ncbi:hypothetical protein K3M67_03140 [Sphingobium sp. V4]|uniref:hypothetical protein n=1 Tax=Sphingobium sp. V4 TaxID=3038927 RepID=UPI002557E1F2|nr:hypothetical protein [Sphingobium sp. V4]WIW88992.1 hypothetical protein K3M67_03140 [Sphingobium sp. V4]
MITIIHGPMRSGKTFHKQAFAKKFDCTHIVDDWQPTIHEVPEDRRLALTYHSEKEIHRAIRKDRPSADVRIIDITTARMLIGVEPYAPYWSGGAAQ